MAFENTGALAFANALSNLGANIGQGLQERYKRDAMAAAVPDMQAGNWGSAGAKLMEIDPATGFKLIEKQRQTDEFNKLYGGGSLSALGAPTPAPGPMNLAGAILAQESGNNPNVGTSVDGARGIGQILPETFNRFAQPGENINNPSDNARVSNRILDTYMQKYGDPARAATAYFSGEGNVAPPGSPTPWKRDTHDGNNKYVSSYVSDIMNRMGGQQTAQAGNIMSDASPSLMAQYNRARWTIANPNMSDAAKEAAKLDLQNIQTMMREDRAANRPTDAQRNYNLARQQGFTGSFMDYQQAQQSGGGSRIERDVAVRRAEGERAGLKDDALQTYALTGKMPKEDQQLTAGDRDAIRNYDEAATSAQNVIGALRQAKDLSKVSMGGPGAGMIAKVGAMTGNETAINTVELDNLISGQALDSLRAVFGGNPTEGERKILLDIQGSSSQPDSVRQRIFDRAIKAAESRLKTSQERANELRGGTYYKPRGQAQPQSGPMAGAQPTMQSGSFQPSGSVSAARPLPADILNEARQAIPRKGRDAVLGVLRQQGFDTSGL